MGSSTGAVKRFRQVFLNLELWSRALGSGLRRRRTWQWRRQGGLQGRRTSRHPPPSPPLSLRSGRRRWRGEWPTSQQLWTWNHLAGHGVGLAQLGAPETSPHGNNGELGHDDGATDGGGDLLAALDAESDVAVVVTDGDEGLEPGT